QQYTCPMHPEVVQDRPGTCPKCGMTLVLVKAGPDKSASAHHDHTHPAATHAASKMAADMNGDVALIPGEHKNTQSFQRYTCPMHPQIVQAAPGNCPLCGMTLVPLTKPKDGAMHSSHASGI